MRKKLFIIALSIFFLGSIFVGRIYQNQKTINEFEFFYSSQLSGKIVKIDRYVRASNFVIDNNPAEFAFYPFTNENLNGNEIFSYLAVPGDSVYKPAYSDTLLLIKGNNVYAYTFQKIGDYM
jgi:hypothetical protein